MGGSTYLPKCRDACAYKAKVLYILFVPFFTFAVRIIATDGPTNVRVAINEHIAASTLGVRPPSHHSPLREFVLFLSVLFLVGVGALNAAPAANATETLETASSPAVPLAIADFDGDHQPDLASIQPGAIGSGDHWVRLWLSTKIGSQYVRVNSREGDLRVEARDVNGDNIVDLVVTSPGLIRPVAVLLNDGHGNFSEVDPSPYTAALEIPKSGWSIANTHRSALALLQRPSSAESALVHCDENPLDKSESLQLHSTLPPVRGIFVLRPGRAPPSSIR